MAEAIEELKSFWKSQGKKMFITVAIGAATMVIGQSIISYIKKKRGEI